MEMDSVYCRALITSVASIQSSIASSCLTMINAQRSVIGCRHELGEDDPGDSVECYLNDRRRMY